MKKKKKKIVHKIAYLQRMHWNQFISLHILLQIFYLLPMDAHILFYMDFVLFCLFRAPPMLSISARVANVTHYTFYAIGIL